MQKAEKAAHLMSHFAKPGVKNTFIFFCHKNFKLDRISLMRHDRLGSFLGTVTVGNLKEIGAGLNFAL